MQTVTISLFVAVEGLPAVYLIAIFFGIGYGGILPLYTVVLRDHFAGRGLDAEQPALFSSAVASADISMI